LTQAAALQKGQENAMTDQRKEQIANFLTKEIMFEGFKTLMEELEQGDTPNTQPACSFYGCTENSRTANLYAGFVAGYTAAIFDTLAVVEEEMTEKENVQIVMSAKEYLQLLAAKEGGKAE
jgi:hypothetical protein